jgi:hypothetical protein
MSNSNCQLVSAVNQVVAAAANRTSDDISVLMAVLEAMMAATDAIAAELEYLDTFIRLSK